MNAGPKFEYFWAEDDIVKTPIRVTAPDYMELFLIWAEGIINDENIFPVQIGSPFPKNFIQVCKAISKQMFRVFAHIYHEHYKFMVDIKIEGQLNASFKYYILFCIGEFPTAVSKHLRNIDLFVLYKEFDLLTDKERTPLQEVIKILLGGYNSLQEKTTSQTSEQAM